MGYTKSYSPKCDWCEEQGGDYNSVSGNHISCDREHGVVKFEELEINEDFQVYMHVKSKGAEKAPVFIKTSSYWACSYDETPYNFASHDLAIRTE